MNAMKGEESVACIVGMSMKINNRLFVGMESWERDLITHERGQGT